MNSCCETKQFQQYRFRKHTVPVRWSSTTFSVNVRRFLNETFFERLTGRRSMIECPQRSPDLPPSYFFLWSHFKNRVNRSKSENIDELRLGIIRENVHSKEFESKGNSVILSLQKKTPQIGQNPSAYTSLFLGCAKRRTVVCHLK